MSDVVTEINNLGLEFIDSGWVAVIRQSEFLEFNDLPNDYENLLETLNLQTTFEDIIEAIEIWLSPNTESSEEKSWTYLSHQINHEKVLALLAYFINDGCKNVTSKEHRSTALLASRVYYKLLSIPGYKAYRIYHSQLFVNSLVCLNFPRAMSENEQNSKELTHDVNIVIRELSKFVLDLRAIIEPLQLVPSDLNFEDILSSLLDVTGGAIVNKLHVDKIELTKVTAVIYDIINVIIKSGGDEPNSTVLRFLFKCLLLKLVALSVDTRNANHIVRASYVTYSGLLLSTYGTAALEAYTFLLEHLCYSHDGLEKQEVRTARVSLVSGLMTLLPRKSYRKFLKWLLVLSTTAKIFHRQVAVDILAGQLNNLPEQPEANNNQNSRDSGIDIDQASENTLNGAQQQPTGDNQNEDQQASIETDNDSTQDSQPPAELEPGDNEDMMGLIHQRAHSVPHEEILRAVYARVHDVSAPLRIRALTILTNCLTSTRPHIIKAIKELNRDGEVSPLTAVGARSVCDERAVVRRAGVALVHRLLATNFLQPQPNELAILVTLCRDASLIVRSSAIAALGELAQCRPSDVVFDAFIAGPLLQLSDPEAKVQAQVSVLIEELLINRLHVFREGGSDDPVPWLFLAAVIRRNMKKHLQKACTQFLDKNRRDKTVINHHTADKLSTHLGALDDERDLQCLLLLVCVARHLEYSNVAFVLNYYYNLARNEESRDVRLMPLTLELMSAWSLYLGSLERSTLRDHLVQRLVSHKDDGCRIARAALAARLDPLHLTWATELMQLSERRAVQDRDIEEAVRAADISLVAPDPPSPELSEFFLSALTDLLPGLSAARAGALAAGAGRLCVRARGAAERLAPALAALLPAATAPMPAKVNALLALADVCVRYTCITEPLLDSVCACVAQSVPRDLRRTTARSLTRLLLGEFLRLRPPFYYKYCALLADEDHEVREPVEYYVTSFLPNDIIFKSIIDCLVYYNQDNSENHLSFDARQLIYDVMLQRLSMVQKTTIQVKLGREVLEYAADLTDENDDDLPADLNGCLLDTISLLCGPQMKLPRKPTEEVADINNLQERVTTNIVSHQMKRTVAEVLVPAALRLHARLRARGGQLVTYLVRFATDLLIDYRQEIEELIDNDDEMVARIQEFQENIGQARSFGNARNLVTSSAPPEPETPRAPRRRRPASLAVASRKRALNM